MRLLAPGARGLPLRLDPDNARARRWLEDELAKAAYQEQNDPLRRMLDALNRLVDQLLSVDPVGAGALPSLAAGLLAAVVAALLLLALRHVRREHRTAGAAGAPVLGGEHLPASALRDRAGRALDGGRFAESLLDSLRALAQTASERTLLEHAPSLTAHEIAEALTRQFPAQAGDLRWAADAFDAVAYGRHDPSRGDAERLRGLDLTLLRTRPGALVAAGSLPASDDLTAVDREPGGAP